MSWSNPLRALIVLAAVACLAAPLSAGVVRHDVSSGVYVDLASEYPSVGQFYATSASGDYYGSGVLIDANWVLTAAHVVDGATSLDFSLGGTVYSAESWLAYPKWDGQLWKGYDIGLAKLPGEGVKGLTPAERYRGSGEIGLVGISVGYGMTGTGLSGAVQYDGQKRAGENVIDAWLRTPGKNPRVFLSDFDNPLYPGDSSLGSPLAQDLEYLIAPGDSGGGVFAAFAGNDYLLGIHSFASATDGTVDCDYGDISGHTRVSAFNDWIDSIISGNSNGNGHGPPPGKGPKKPRGGDSALGETTIPDIPEPSTLCLLCVAGLCLIAARWRRRR
jgi:hypothetical protein